jgi:cation:H+ antiporter
VEAVLAWHKETPLLLANLTGALRLLTGTGWPLIYFAAAMSHRKRTGQPLNKIELEEHHSVEIVGLAVPLLYIPVIAFKGSLSVWDGLVLIVCYVAYLLILGKLPSEDHETIDDLERIPRAIVQAKKPVRISMIAGLFFLGGLLIYLGAKPFLASLLGLSESLGVPDFVFIQWIAPLVSEFPEMASTLYWARRAGRAPMSLMNMVSSNINQWTMLTAMLPIIYSFSVGSLTPIVFNAKQTTELWLTVAQAAMGVIFLLNMELAWWEAVALGVLFLVPFANERFDKLATYVYAIWASIEVFRMLTGSRKPRALPTFGHLWRTYVNPARA